MARVIGSTSTCNGPLLTKDDVVCAIFQSSRPSRGDSLSSSVEALKITLLAVIIETLWRLARLTIRTGSQETSGNSNLIEY